MKFKWLACLCLSITAVAQTITPVVVQFGSKKGKAEGSFTVKNEGVTPLRAILQPVSFGPRQDNKPTAFTLDSSIHVDLSESSTRLGPQQEKTIFYSVLCDKLPCWLMIVSSFTGEQNTKEGVLLSLNLAHTVYLCAKEDGCRARIWKEQLKQPAP